MTEQTDVRYRLRMDFSVWTLYIGSPPREEVVKGFLWFNRTPKKERAGEFTKAEAEELVEAYQAEYPSREVILEEV